MQYLEVEPLQVQLAGARASPALGGRGAVEILEGSGGTRWPFHTCPAPPPGGAAPERQCLYLRVTASGNVPSSPESFPSLGFDRANL